MLDLDRRALTWYGGEDVVFDVPQRRRYHELAAHPWRGFELSWAHGGVADLADTLGLARATVLNPREPTIEELDVVGEIDACDGDVLITVRSGDGLVRWACPTLPQHAIRASEHLLAVARAITRTARATLEELPTSGVHLDLVTREVDAWTAWPSADLPARLANAIPLRMDDAMAGWYADPRRNSRGGRAGGPRMSPCRQTPPTPPANHDVHPGHPERRSSASELAAGTPGATYARRWTSASGARHLRVHASARPAPAYEPRSTSWTPRSTRSSRQETRSRSPINASEKKRPRWSPASSAKRQPRQTTSCERSPQIAACADRLDKMRAPIPNRDRMKIETRARITRCVSPTARPSDESPRRRNGLRLASAGVRPPPARIAIDPVRARVATGGSTARPASRWGHDGLAEGSRACAFGVQVARDGVAGTVDGAAPVLVTRPAFGRRRCVGACATGRGQHGIARRAVAALAARHRAPRSAPSNGPLPRATPRDLRRRRSCAGWSQERDPRAVGERNAEDERDRARSRVLGVSTTRGVRALRHAGSGHRAARSPRRAAAQRAGVADRARGG